jgi:hypothetical protein
MTFRKFVAPAPNDPGLGAVADGVPGTGAYDGRGEIR